ncbi:MAG: sialidase family protein, partial [Acidimicrobiales bacterium]
AWGRDRTLYLATSGWDTPDGGPGGMVSVVLSRSTDLGETWQQTVVRDARGRTGPAVESHNAVAAVVVDPSGPQDIVYVGWRASYPNAPTLPGGLRALRPPLLAVSEDGGRSFAEPVDVSASYAPKFKAADGTELPIGMGFTAPSLALDGDGTLYALYPAAAPSAFPPASATPELPMLLAKSTDRGRTFSFTEAVPRLAHNEGVQILRWTRQGGARGTLHMIFEDKPDQPRNGADRDIFHARSTDGGATFSAPRRLNDDDPAQLRVQVTPNLAVTDDGRVEAVWWDFRHDRGSFVNDVYAAYSTDNGSTWSANLRLSDQSVDRRLGVWSNGYDIRQPPGIAAAPELSVVAWDDTRLGNAVTESQDIFARALQYEPL